MFLNMKALIGAKLSNRNYTNFALVKHNNDDLAIPIVSNTCLIVTSTRKQKET